MKTKIIGMASLLAVVILCSGWLGLGESKVKEEQASLTSQDLSVKSAAEDSSEPVAPDIIELTQFSLSTDGTSSSEMTNNSSRPVTLVSIKLIQGAAELSREYLSADSEFIIPANGKRADSYSDPDIKSFCGVKGIPFSFDIVISYIAENGTIEELEKKLEGACIGGSE